ncbi:MAG: hypothetical protein DHS20C16_08800 [Phycisphaerae bacterium]|nr:MAG: hypothetical protein DHS20C16_08800 [Phycisphaerae bacterium]
MTTAQSIEGSYNPPRLKWTKRVTWVSLGLVVLIVSLWGSATIIAQRRLDKLIASYRAAGEPVYIEDFNVFKDITDEHNAATYYTKAELVYRWPRSIDSSIDLEDVAKAVQLGDVDKFASEIHALISSNGEALELLKRGAECDAVEWKTAVKSPLMEMVLPNLGPQRDLARLLNIAAEQSFEANQDRQAVEFLAAQLSFGNHISADPPMLVVHQLGVGVHAQACRVIERHVSTLRIASVEQPSGLVGATTPQVRELMQRLLDERAMLRSFLLAFSMEKATYLDAIGRMCVGKDDVGLGLVPSKLVAMGLRPVWTTDCCRTAAYQSQQRTAYLEDTYPKARAANPGDYLTADDVSMVLHPGVIWAFSWDRPAQFDFNLRALRRMTATALAIRLFEVEHGHRPETLDRLVPEFLESIPRDPFAEGDEPIQYRPGADPPVLYCVGQDGFDDGGRFQLNKYGSVDLLKLDLVFFLNGDRPQAN